MTNTLKMRKVIAAESVRRNLVGREIEIIEETIEESYDDT